MAWGKAAGTSCYKRKATVFRNTTFEQNRQLVIIIFNWDNSHSNDKDVPGG